MPIPFIRKFESPYEESVVVSPLITRVLARNPGPFTFKGTSTYIVGHQDVAVIDPGPDIPEHVEALKRTLAGRKVTHILVTHTHLDHSPAAAALKDWSGAPTYAFGPHGSGKSGQDISVEEGSDMLFAPDILVSDANTIAGESFTFECVYTPGHTSNHMCFALCEEQALFSGDHVMGWSTTVVAPPDGDMTQYMASLRKLLMREDRILYPTHGAPVPAPKPYLQAYLSHRLEREEQILGCIRDGVFTIPNIVQRIYADLDARLHAAAARSVLAHLIKLKADGRIIQNGDRYLIG